MPERPTVCRGLEVVIARSHVVSRAKRITRRTLLASAAAAGAVGLGDCANSTTRRKTFTILHTNDMHSAFIGMGPAQDYSPTTTGDDGTRGGYARLATLIAARRKEREAHGPVLVLDAGDYSMGTPFGAATRQVGSELRLMARMGYDATTFGNHEWDLGPDGLGSSIRVAATAGRIPAVIGTNTHIDARDPAQAELARLSD
jgi:5'-nucleotidase